MFQIILITMLHCWGGLSNRPHEDSSTRAHCYVSRQVRPGKSEAKRTIPWYSIDVAFRIRQAAQLSDPEGSAGELAGDRDLIATSFIHRSFILANLCILLLILSKKNSPVFVLRDLAISRSGTESQNLSAFWVSYTAVQIVALVSGAPTDDSGQPTNKAAVDWSIMGAEEGTRGMTWQEIEQGSYKLRAEGGGVCKTAASEKRKREGGLRGNDTNKAAFLAKGQDSRHSHACILPECGMFCTPIDYKRAGQKDIPRIRHGCRVANKTINGLNEHMCRNCHQTATQCKAAVCTYIASSQSQEFCEYLHAQEDAMKTSATEASAVQASVILPWCFLSCTPPSSRALTCTKALFILESADCIRFLHAPKRLVHMKALFDDAFYKHQNVFYTWVCFLHTLFTRTKSRTHTHKYTPLVQQTSLDLL